MMSQNVYPIHASDRILVALENANFKYEDCLLRKKCMLSSFSLQNLREISKRYNLRVSSLFTQKVECALFILSPQTQQTKKKQFWTRLHSDKWIACEGVISPSKGTLLIYAN